jgi:hypothetical protein
LKVNLSLTSGSNNINIDADTGSNVNTDAYTNADPTTLPPLSTLRLEPSSRAPKDRATVVTTQLSLILRMAWSVRAFYP